jgi:FdhD protein
MARTGLPADGGFLLLTSRVSMEMAQKAAMAGIGLLAGMSAPTLAAIEAAEDAGMTLLAFARGQGFVCYTHPAGIGLEA